MNRVSRWQWLMMAVVAISAMSASCKGTDRINLRGRVFDGVTGQAIQNYTVVIELAENEKRNAKVVNGEYFVGPIPPYQDFTIRITADGYREFYTHIGGTATPTTGSGSRDLTAYREATLFPTNVPTPATNIRIFLSNAQALPTGFVRLRPTATGASALFNEISANPTGSVVTTVPTTLANSGDLQQAVLVRDLANGIVTFAQGELVYGVTYIVDVFGVSGYGFSTDTSNTIEAGSSDNFFLTISPITSGGAGALQIVFVNTQNQSLIANGSLVVGFSEPVEFTDTVTTESMVEALDASLTVDLVSTGGASIGNVDNVSVAAPTGNADGDTTESVFKGNNTNMGAVANDHGINMSLDSTGLTLTLSWGGQAAFSAFDSMGEAILRTNWSSLDSILVRRRTRANGAESSALSAIPYANGGGPLGTTESVQMIPQP